MKYLILLILLLLAVWLWSSHTRRASRRGSSTRQGTPAEDMVQCSQCGLHLPLSESVQSARGYYCSTEHRRLRESAR